MTQNDGIEAEIEIPTPEGDPSLQAALDAFTRDISEEYRQAGLDQYEEDPAPAGEPAEPETPGDPAVPPEAKPAEPAPHPREAEIARRDQELTERARQVAALEADLREKAKTARDLRRVLDQDPESALRELGLDPDLTVKRLLVRRLGDKAPPELLAAIREGERERRIDQLERDLKAKEENIQFQGLLGQIRDGAVAHLAAPELPKSAPAVAVLFQKDRARAEREVFEVIREDAERRLRSGESTDAPVMTYQRAVEVLEARYSPFLVPVSAVAPPASAAGGAPAAAPAAAKKPVAPRPLRPPWMPQEDDQLEAGIRVATAEYRRLESTRR